MSRQRLVWKPLMLILKCCAIAGAVLAVALVWSSGASAAPQQEVVDGNDPGITLPKVVSQIKPQYTPEALQEEIEGTVTMSAVVRTDGTATDIVVTQSLDTEHGLDTQAMTALRQWRFEPGQRDSKPVAVRVTVEMRFTLRN